MDDRYRGVFDGREVVFMNKTDIKKENLNAGDLVDIFSEYEGVKREIKKYKVVEYELPSGCMATYFPEANVLIPIDLYSAESLTPASKSVKVNIRKSV